MSSSIRSVVRGTAVVAMLAVGFLILQRDGWSAARARQSPDPSDAKKIPIYVGDFELSSTVPVRANATTPLGAGQRKSGQPIYADSDSAPMRARRIVDAFANTLVDLLQKDGYTATRVSGNTASRGVLLRGVFAETDEQNRIRRAILGGGSPKATFVLYVAAFNLALPDQPLYQRAVVQSPDPHYGPVITMNAYVPMVKLEVDKNPVEEDVKKISREIVSQLTKLLAANPTALPQ